MVKKGRLQEYYRVNSMAACGMNLFCMVNWQLLSLMIFIIEGKLFSYSIVQLNLFAFNQTLYG